MLVGIPWRSRPMCGFGRFDGVHVSVDAVIVLSEQFYRSRIELSFTLQVDLSIWHRLNVRLLGLAKNSNLACQMRTPVNQEEVQPLS